jgi:hypothetical protein
MTESVSHIYVVHFLNVSDERHSMGVTLTSTPIGAVENLDDYQTVVFSMFDEIKIPYTRSEVECRCVWHRANVHRYEVSVDDVRFDFECVRLPLFSRE